MLGYIAFASVALLVLMFCIAAVFLFACAASGSKQLDRKSAEPDAEKTAAPGSVLN